MHNITHKDRTGFTIVELLVVIAVIGILAGIVIMSYGAWRTKAAAGEVKSDLNGVVSAMESSRTFNNGYPSSIPPSFSGSSDVTLTYVSGDTDGYCVNAQSKVVTSVHYYIDTTRGNKDPQQGYCIGSIPFDPSLPNTVASTGLSTTEMAIRVNAQGVVYSSDYGAIKSYDPTTKTLKTVSTVNTAALAIGPDGTLYTFSDFPPTDPGPVTVLKVDPTTGSATVFSPTTIGRGMSLMIDGNTLYAAGSHTIYSFDLTTGNATLLFSTSGSLYSRGLAKIGNILYFLWGSDDTIHALDLSSPGSAPTSVATIPTSSSGFGAGRDLVASNGFLYTFGDAGGITALDKYQISSGTWSIAISNVAPNQPVPKAGSSCTNPQAFDIYGGRAYYTGYNSWSGCGGGASGQAPQLFMTPVS